MAIDSKVSAQAILSRYNVLYSHLMTQLNRWRDIGDLFWPAKSDILRGWEFNTVDRDRTLELYDSTGLRARRLLAGNLQSAVTNPSIQWFRLRFRNDEINEDYEVAPWLATVDDRMLLAYNASNFYAEAFQYYSQLGVFGTAAMFVAQRQDVWLESGSFALRFKTLYPGSYVLAEGQFGTVDTLMRVLKFTPRQAMQRWGNEAPDRVRKIMTTSTNGQPSNTKMDEPERYLHIVCPREDRPSRGNGDNRSMPWADIVVDMDSQEIISESGWEEFPYMVSRWEREGITAWGYGPGHEALPDAKTLNALVEIWLQMAEFMVKPPLQILNGALLGDLRFAPLAKNIVEQRDAVSPMNIQGNPQQIPLEIARLQKAIRDAYHVDDLLALPPVDQAGRMTATEVSQRIALMQQYMGPVFTMLLSDYLDPLADRVFGLMMRSGVLPQPPDLVFIEAQRAGGQLDVEYEGPLSRSQRASEVQAFNDLLTIGARVQEATGTPEWQDNFDIDLGLRKASRVLGIRRDILRDPREVSQMRNTRQQQAAEQQQARAINEGARALRDGGQGLEALQRAQTQSGVEVA